MAAVVGQYEVLFGDVVEDSDRDLERHHPVVVPADQENGRLYSGEVGGVVDYRAIGGAGRHRRALDRKIAMILRSDAEFQSLGGLMIEILRYWGKQVHKFAELWCAVISRLTANNSEEFRCYSAVASSER